MHHAGLWTTWESIDKALQRWPNGKHQIATPATLALQALSEWKAPSILAHNMEIPPIHGIARLNQRSRSKSP